MKRRRGPFFSFFALFFLSYLGFLYDGHSVGFKVDFPWPPSIAPNACGIFRLAQVEESPSPLYRPKWEKWVDVFGVPSHPDRVQRQVCNGDEGNSRGFGSADSNLAVAWSKTSLVVTGEKRP